jgi:hypothetical protein
MMELLRAASSSLKAWDLGVLRAIPSALLAVVIFQIGNGQNPDPPTCTSLYNWDDRLALPPLPLVEMGSHKLFAWAGLEPWSSWFLDYRHEPSCLAPETIFKQIPGYSVVLWSWHMQLTIRFYLFPINHWLFHVCSSFTTLSFLQVTSQGIFFHWRKMI